MLFYVIQVWVKHIKRVASEKWRREEFYIKISFDNIKSKKKITHVFSEYKLVSILFLTVWCAK